MTPCNGRISHYKPITLSARYMTRIPVGYQDPVGILATRFRSGHIDLQIRSSSDYLGLLDIPVRSRPERILEVIRSGPGFSGPESDRNRIYSGTLPSLLLMSRANFPTRWFGSYAHDMLILLTYTKGLQCHGQTSPRIGLDHIPVTSTS